MKSLVVISIVLLSLLTQASDGSIGTGRYIAGGVLSIYPGFGIGHAVQGRYLQKGWIFTVGEVASAYVVLDGLGKCGLTAAIYNNGTCSGTENIVAGVAVFLGFKIWEIIDAWSGSNHQKKNDEKQNSTNTQPMDIFPLLEARSDGVIAGVNIRF